MTGSFIPLELYESTRHPSVLRILVLFANLAIVWYLARSLRRHQEAGTGTHASGQLPTLG